MKLSAYTIAKNCSDLSDVNAGIDEMKKYFADCDKENKKPTTMAYIRFSKLGIKKDKFLKTMNRVNYPIAFLTGANKIVYKSKSEKSQDGTPRYTCNPKSPDNTYTFLDCLKDWKPIYTKKELK